LKNCLDEGTLQAYLDGELSAETSNGVAAHLAACGTCAGAAGAAEQELALFSEAFAPAFSASVPTEKLRARLDEAIAGLNTPPLRPAPATSQAHGSRLLLLLLRSYFDSLLASLKTFTPRQATAFASFLVAVALAVVFALMQTPDRPNAPEQIARNNPMPASPVVQTGNGAARDNRDASAARNVESAARDNNESASRDDNESAPGRPGDERAAIARSERAAAAKVGLSGVRARVGVTRDAGGNAGEAANTPDAAIAATTVEPLLADEKTYLSSIASLTSAIEAEGAAAMTPTLRAEYERNLAVVNQAIVSSRVAARRNPQDTDAKEFLRAAYQNKVELLSAVADQTQLASGRD
jgi:hypothetical protein